MPRPVRLEPAGALTPRDAIWAAVRRFGKGQSFSIVEISFMTGQHQDTIRSYLLALVKANILCWPVPTRPLHRPLQPLAHFALMRDVGVAAPRINSAGEPVTDGRQQMWSIMRRARGAFNFRDIAFRASIEEHPVAPQEARDYIRHLALAGYLRLETPRRADGPGQGADSARYIFLSARNTGPRAPVVTREKCVIDGNTGAIVFNPKESGK